MSTSYQYIYEMWYMIQSDQNFHQWQCRWRHMTRYCTAIGGSSDHAIQILHCHWWKFWSRDSDLLLIISRVSNRHSAFRQNYAELRAIIVFACFISLRGISLWLWTRKQLNIQGIALQRLFHLKFSNFEQWLKMIHAADLRIEMNRRYLFRF